MAEPKKRMPFKRTVQRQDSAPKPPQDDDDDGLSLFKRSKDVLPIAVADHDRRIKRKHGRAEARRRSSTADHKDLIPEPTPYEVARLASEHYSSDAGSPVQQEDSFGDPISPPLSKRSRTSANSGELKVKESPFKALDGTPSKQPVASRRISRQESPTPAHNVISLDDDSEEEDIYGATPIRQLRGGSEEPPYNATPSREHSPDVEIVDDHFADSPPPEEDEFQEYIIQARERQQRAQAQPDAPHINLLVSTEIAGIEPKEFKFTLTKPLSIVKNAWINLFSGRGFMSDLEIRRVFLTWRGRKVYDWTTLDSLEIRPRDADGRYSAGNTLDDEGFSDDWTRVHMEIWTEDLYDEYLRQKEKTRLQSLGELDYSDEEEVEVPEPEAKIKVVLKSKDAEPIKTTVRPSTTMETIVIMFRKMRQLPSDKEVTLMFDGDKLEEHMTVEDADIGDMETIEVHVK